MDDADETMFLALMLSLIVFVFLPLTGVLLATSSGCTLLAAGDLMLHQKACLWGSWSVVGLCVNMFGWAWYARRSIAIAAAFFLRQTVHSTSSESCLV